MLEEGTFTRTPDTLMAKIILRSRPRVSPGGFDPELRFALEARMENEIRRLQRTAELMGPIEHQRSSDEVDLTADRMGQDTAFAVLARCAEGISEWSEALGRLRADPDSFGRCVICQEGIPLERLEILPTARTCLDCR